MFSFDFFPLNFSLYLCTLEIYPDYTLLFQNFFFFETVLIILCCSYSRHIASGLNSLLDFFFLKKILLFLDTFLLWLLKNGPEQVTLKKHAYVFIYALCKCPSVHLFFFTGLSFSHCKSISSLLPQLFYKATSIS